MKKDLLSMKRLTENEAVFRKYNERVQAELASLTEFAQLNDRNVEIHTDEMQVHFFCECSDENCRERVEMSIAEYGKIHENRSRFIIIEGHQVDVIEKMIENKQGYFVVEKFLMPPEEPQRLHATDIQNA